MSTSSNGPQVGDRAPEFVLRRTFTETVSLGDALRDGPVVLAFYVFDFGNR
jgi:peroxiredoxin